MYTIVVLIPTYSHEEWHNERARSNVSPIIVSSQDDEAQMHNSFDNADMDLTEEDINILINDEPNKELAPKLSWLVANIESSWSSFIGGPTTSAPSNPPVSSWVVNPDLT